MSSAQSAPDSNTPLGNSFGNFASIDTAYETPASMANIVPQSASQNISYDQNAFLDPVSEEKINNKVDELLGSMYKDSNNLQYPATVEAFNTQDLQQAWNNVNTQSETTTGMSTIKLIILVILIVVLVYAIYWLFKNRDKGFNMIIEKSSI